MNGELDKFCVECQSVTEHVWKEWTMGQEAWMCRNCNTIYSPDRVLILLFKKLEAIEETLDRVSKSLHVLVVQRVIG